MTRPEAPIHAFRRRLLQLIDERFEGRYTALAQRAGIPVSSMQHCVHTAKHLPGGEHLMRMAVALGVTVHELITGDAAGRPEAAPGPAAHVSLPVFRCICPGPCPLAEPVPPVAAAHARAVVPIALLRRYRAHRFVAVEVTPQLPGAGWRVGAQLVVDWDARAPRWTALALLHDGGHCRLGHVAPSGDRLLFAARPDAAPALVSPEGRILGTVVAGVTAL